ncbi:MAG: protoheme IX farnesyltransferase [Desulfuromonadales bacterium]|nr:protoheme IX farnesyltransferase [Desulfuromonadales bacterium]
MNGVAAVGGYLLFSSEAHRGALCALFLGVLFLAAAGSALNQVLERDLDRLMLRTMIRPLPRGDLTTRAATSYAGVALCAGVALLVVFCGSVSVLMGATALFWYLAVYTPLKRRSNCALVFGAVCGALTPVIGWCAAGGSPFDYRIMFLAGLLYLWQVPHFWLLQRRHADDYQRAGLPLVVMGVEGGVVSSLFWLWIVALVAGTMLLPAFGIIPPRASLWYAAFPLPLVLLFMLRSEKALFSYLNLFPLLVTLPLIEL